MQYKLKTLLVILSGLVLTSSCEEQDFFPCVEPIGGEFAEDRPVMPFNSVNVAVPATVYIEYAEENTITVVASENILNEISTVSRNNTLYLDNTRCLNVHNDDITVYITTPDINTIKVLGSGNVYIESPFQGNMLSLEVSGSGDIYFPEMTYNRIQSSISGSGNITVIGQVSEHIVQISGSGKVKAFELLTQQANVHISGSGSARVMVEKQLDARISGSGNIYYIGNPGMSVNISGTGAIFHIANN